MSFCFAKRHLLNTYKQITLPLQWMGSAARVHSAHDAILPDVPTHHNGWLLWLCILKYRRFIVSGRSCREQHEKNVVMPKLAARPCVHPNPFCLLTAILPLKNSLEIEWPPSDCPKCLCSAHRSRSSHLLCFKRPVLIFFHFVWTYICHDCVWGVHGKSRKLISGRSSTGECTKIWLLWSLHLESLWVGWTWTTKIPNTPSQFTPALGRFLWTAGVVLLCDSVLHADVSCATSVFLKILPTPWIAHTGCDWVLVACQAATSCAYARLLVSRVSSVHWNIVALAIESTTASMCHNLVPKATTIILVFMLTRDCSRRDLVFLHISWHLQSTREETVSGLAAGFVWGHKCKAQPIMRWWELWEPRGH